jgi:heme/copper-type cytochrome/quinol oxidase subunit 3
MIVGEGFTSHGNVLAGMVYLIGGVHAVHLIAGLTVLGWLWYQLIQSRQVKPVRYQMIGWFWHFLTALWCIIFVFFLIIL